MPHFPASHIAKCISRNSVKILAGETSEAVFWLTKYPCQGAGVPLTSLALLEYASRKHSVFVAYYILSV